MPKKFFFILIILFFITNAYSIGTKEKADHATGKDGDWSRKGPPPASKYRLGYKESLNSDMQKAICYNCKRKKGCRGMECNMCCEEQKNKEKYPNLSGPDYAFRYDYNERLEKRDEFEGKNLSPIKLLS